jgi:hypothetical protein
MILGMTGTRNKLTEQQRSWLKRAVAACGQLHHGACVNADEEAHDAADESDKAIVVHPPTDERLMMPSWKWSQRACIYVMPAKPYLERNRDIVNDTDRMIALPDGPEKPKGGTWYTVRYALEIGKGVTICYPDGTVEDRLPSLTYGPLPEPMTDKRQERT